MSSNELVHRLMDTFVDELQGHASTLGRDLRSLQETSSEIERTDLIGALLRTTHSMKGAAQSVRVKVLSHAAHLMEEVLLGLKRRELDDRTREEGLAVLFSAVDAVHDLEQRLRRGLRRQADHESSDLFSLLPRLEDLAVKDARAAADPPSSARTTPRRRLPSPDPSDDRSARRTPATTQLIDNIASDLSAMASNLAEEVAKQIDFQLTHSGVEADHRILEGLLDPLRHLVRNAIDHGIEGPASRVAAGKPPRGTIEVEISRSDSELNIVVRDDGAGVDREGLLEEARRLGMEPVEGRAEAANLAFAAGLSTSPIVTQRYGRGIGLDVVRTTVQSLGGSISVESQPGQGSEFTISIPVQSAYTQALVVESAGSAFAFPEEGIEELRRVRPQEVRWILGRPTLLDHGSVLPIVALAELLDTSFGPPDERQQLSISGAGVVMRRGDTSILLRVDNVVGRQQLRPLALTERLSGHPLIEAAGLTEADQIVMILSPQEIIQRALRRVTPSRSGLQSDERSSRHKVLLVESSQGMRTTIEQVLQSAGLDVALATDEKSALRHLSGGRIDLLITSAEESGAPPALVAKMRAREDLDHVPIVLLAPFEDPSFSREIEDLGVEALVRRTDFTESRFLETLRRLL